MLPCQNTTEVELCFSSGLGYNTLMAGTDTTAGSAPTGPQPGQVVTPGQAGIADKPPEQPQEPAPTGPTPPTVPAPPAAPAGSGISWTASEFVAHEKSVGWYGAFILVGVAVDAIVYWLTKDKVSAAVVLVCALALIVLAGKKPRQLQYKVDDKGITIGQKHFEYGLFKSFAVLPEGAFSSIVLMPLKRFAPLTTIYFAPDDEDKIIDVLSKRLPFEEHKLDAVDSVMRHIRF